MFDDDYEKNQTLYIESIIPKKEICFSRPLSNPVGSQYKHVAKSHSALANGTTTQEFAEEVVEQITSIDENLHNVIGASENGDCEGARSSCHQSEVKALILFEDVDITFLEDRGFIAAVQQIAETAKGPIILTSNSKRLSGFNGLDRTSTFVFGNFYWVLIIVVVNPRSRSSPA